MDSTRMMEKEERERMSNRPKATGPVQRVVSNPKGWVLWVAPQLCIGSGSPMAKAPSRWNRFWQRVLLGFRWEYKS